MSRAVGNTDHERELGNQLQRLLGQDLNPKTIAAYDSAKTKFETWLKDGDWSREWSMDLVRILYLTEMIKQGKSSVVPPTLSALNYYYGRIKSDFEQLLKSVLKAAARKAEPVKHREKVQKADYEKFISTQEETEDRVSALGVLLFRGMLRISEALALEEKDLTANRQTWSIQISKSKTDQLGKGTVRAFEATEQEHKILSKWVERVKEKKFIYVFQTENGSNRPIAYSTANKIISERWENRGMADRNYTTHAFRGGGASTALEEGALQANVQRFGRWKSEKAFESYVREAVQIQTTRRSSESRI